MAITIAIFFIIGALGSAFYHYIYEQVKDNEECHSSIIVFYKDTTSYISINYMYSTENKTGIVAISGKYFEDGKVKGIIRRDIEYSWTENHDSFVFHSINVNKYAILETVSDDTLANILPDFFVYPDKTVSYLIQNQGTHGYLFLAGKRPLFYCSR